MKRILAIVLSLIFCISLVSCSNGDKHEVTEAEAKNFVNSISDKYFLNKIKSAPQKDDSGRNITDISWLSLATSGEVVEGIVFERSDGKYIAASTNKDAKLSDIMSEDEITYFTSNYDMDYIYAVNIKDLQTISDKLFGIGTYDINGDIFSKYTCKGYYLFDEAPTKTNAKYVSHSIESIETNGDKATVKFSVVYSENGKEETVNYTAKIVENEHGIGLEELKTK